MWHEMCDTYSLSDKEKQQLDEIYRYGEVVIKACESAGITEEQAMEFMRVLSTFRKSNDS